MTSAADLATVVVDQQRRRRAHRAGAAVPARERGVAAHVAYAGGTRRLEQLEQPRIAARTAASTAGRATRRADRPVSSSAASFMNSSRVLAVHDDQSVVEALEDVEPLLAEVA